MGEKKRVTGVGKDGRWDMLGGNKMQRRTHRGTKRQWPKAEEIRFRWSCRPDAQAKQNFIHLHTFIASEMQSSLPTEKARTPLHHLKETRWILYKMKFRLQTSLMRWLNKNTIWNVNTRIHGIHLCQYVTRIRCTLSHIHTHTQVHLTDTERRQIHEDTRN